MRLLDPIIDTRRQRGDDQFASVTRASRLQICLHERDYPTLPETACTIWWTFRPHASSPKKTTLETFANGSLVNHILPRLAS